VAAVAAIVAARAVLAIGVVVVVVIGVLLAVLLLLVVGLLKGGAAEAAQLGALLVAVPLGVVGVGLRVIFPGRGILGGFLLLNGGEVL